MDQTGFSANLKTTIIDQPFYYQPSVDSTMDWARQFAQRGTPSGTVVLADEQTARRGSMFAKT